MLQIRAVGQNDRDCLRVAVDDSGNAVDHERGNLRRVLDRCAGVVLELRVDVDVARGHDERPRVLVDGHRLRARGLQAVAQRARNQLLAIVRFDSQLNLFTGSSRVRGCRDRAAADVCNSDLVGAVRVGDLLNRDGERAHRCSVARCHGEVLRRAVFVIAGKRIRQRNTGLCPVFRSLLTAFSRLYLSLRRNGPRS